MAVVALQEDDTRLIREDTMSFAADLNDELNVPCLLDDVCVVLGLPRRTRMAEVLYRLEMLQRYIYQLDRIQGMADG